MNCPSTSVMAEQEFSRYVFYKLFALIPVFAALIAMTRYAEANYWPLIYIGLCLLHAGIMFTIKCPHCPRYKTGGNLHRCFMIWGAPKIYKARSGPEKRFVSIYAPLGMLTLTVFPIYWLLSQWELLFIYLLSIAVLIMAINLNECPRCPNFACSHNTVPPGVREASLKHSAL